MKRKRSYVDVRIENHGSLYLLRPLSPEARSWFEENVPEGDKVQYFGGALVVEPRFVGDVLVGIRGEGMVAQ